MSDKLPKEPAPDISWASQEEAFVLDSQNPDYKTGKVLPFNVYSRKAVEEAQAPRNQAKQEARAAGLGDAGDWSTVFGISESADTRPDPEKDVAKRIRFTTSEELTTFIEQIVEDLINLINNPEVKKTLGSTGFSLQINGDVEEIAENFSLLITKLKEEGHTSNEEIMGLCKAQIEPLNESGKVTLQSAYKILLANLEKKLLKDAKAGTEEHAKAGTEKAAQYPGGGSKYVKKRFKTQKKGKCKGKGKSVRRRRGKVTKKPKSNKKRSTKRLKK
jgi:hypothetical protein